MVGEQKRKKKNVKQKNLKQKKKMFFFNNCQNESFKDTNRPIKRHKSKKKKHK